MGFGFARNESLLLRFYNVLLIPFLSFTTSVVPQVEMGY